MSGDPLLLCCDLDRTLLPNGSQPESPGAREAFARIARSPLVTLAYVTGRDPALMERAVAEYALPDPAVAVTDVGTRIRSRTDDGWRPWPEWERAIAADWRGHDHAALAALFADLADLTLQEAARQAPFKLSYELSAREEPASVLATMTRRLEARGVRASLVFSVDETTDTGLLDVLPAGATKLHAIDCVRASLGFTVEQVVFAGDSGNDLPVLASALPSVLVANATEAVREAAVRQARAAGNEGALYLARGAHQGRNGYYADGVLEGLAHFRPDLFADAPRRQRA